MTKNFSGLPDSLELVTSGDAPYNGNCHECDKKIGVAPYLIIYRKGRSPGVFCSKCCRSKLDSLLNFLDFMSNDIKPLLGYFPKHTKSKPESIESGILSSL